MEDLIPKVQELWDAYGFKPRWRGKLHAAAFFVTLPAGIALLASAETTVARVAVAVYVASLAGLFAASASYHRFAHTVRSVTWLRRLDHSMIFVLIAGTYTPICLIVLPRAWCVPFLVVVWVTALAGIINKMVRLGLGNSPSGSWLYIVLGWGSVVVLPMLLTRLNVLQLVLLATGGLLFTVGAVILAKRRPDPSPTVFGYHEVWHAFTIVAVGCHFAMVASLVA